eukprot:COSAG01_NODE_39771_length_472_cov_1.029491_1_plen_21_part_01
MSSEEDEAAHGEDEARVLHPD